MNLLRTEVPTAVHYAASLNFFSQPLLTGSPFRETINQDPIAARPVRGDLLRQLSKNRQVKYLEKKNANIEILSCKSVHDSKRETREV